VAILLMAINRYFVSGCWWLLMIIVLVAIGKYYIGGYRWILVGIGGY